MHWIVCTLAGVFLATSILLIFVAYLNYITDSYLMYAASALAANTVARSAAGAAAPLFTNYMFSALGIGGGGSLIGGVACLLAPIPFLFYKYGRGIRERSKFAPTAPKPAEKRAESEEEQDVPADRRSELSTSDEEERELDDQAGVPSPAELEKEIEKERSRDPSLSGVTQGQQEGGDRFLDASGMEKAER